MLSARTIGWLLIAATTSRMLVIHSGIADAGGISADAGITPPEDRWILRTQTGYMLREAATGEMDHRMRTYVFLVVIAYGLRPDVTVMLRQAVIHQEMTMNGTTEENTGLSDPFMLVKYKAFRRNTPEYTIGIAPTVGVEPPVGSDAFSSETCDLRAGLYVSWRSGPWASDINVAHKWNALGGKSENGVVPGDELSLDLALAHQLSIGEKAGAAVAQVLELNYLNTHADQMAGQDVPDTGESVLHLSPGVKFSTASLILEALLQIPVWQDQKGSQLERELAALAGIRFMF